MKILFTSVGRRVELMQAFRDAGKELGVNLTICGADITDNAPALFFCDKTFKVCRISDDDYIPSLLKICQDEKIDALIPTIDTDLLILSQNKQAFSKIGTKVVISGEKVIKICRDKNTTAVFFNGIGLSCPKAINDVNKYDLGFPAFIRPKDGSSSVNAFKVNDINELNLFTKMIKDYIISPYVDGVEYTVDALCDFEGNPVYITPRIRLAVRSGEVLKTQIVLDKTIIEETKVIIKNLKPCGAITIQLIRDKADGKDYYIEINPRFGGGAPLSIKAGADSAYALLKLLKGEKMSYIENGAADGAVFSRFDQSIRVN